MAKETSENCIRGASSRWRVGRFASSLACTHLQPRYLIFPPKEPMFATDPDVASDT
jgi:hypothetical protein